MDDFELVYIDRQDGKITLWDSPAPGRIECFACVDMDNQRIVITQNDDLPADIS